MYGGRYNNATRNDVYITGDGTTNSYKCLIAHELGHYFAARQSGNIPVPPGFKDAFEKDKKIWDEGIEKPHELLTSLFKEVDNSDSYNDEEKKLAEYFTRACVEFPILLYLQQATR